MSKDDHNGTSTFILIKQENLCACSEASCMGIFSVKNCRFVKHMLHHQARNHLKQFEEISIPAGA